MDLWPAQDFFVTSIAFVGQVEVVDHVMLDFGLPFAFGSYDTGPRTSEGSATLGNPWVGAHYGANVTRGVALWGGGTITFPTIIRPGLIRGIIAGLAAADRAGFDVDRFAIEDLTIRPRGGIEVRAADIFYYRGFLGLPLYIPTSRRAGDTQFLIEQGNDFELRALMGLGGGIRLQFVAIATDTFVYGRNPRDRFQAAIEPYFVYEPVDRSGFFVRAGALIALDEPLGPGFDQDKLATFTASLGGKF